MADVDDNGAGGGDGTDNLTVQFVNPDGTFKEGWQEAYVPEDFRGLGVYKSVTDLKTAMAQLGNLEKLKGRQGKGVMPLTADSTPTERDLFYAAIGRPAKPEDYKIDVPKEAAEFYTEPLLKETREALHGAGLTQAQVAAVMALDAKRLVAGAKSLEGAQAAAKVEAETALREKWGVAYDERLAVANRMVEENVADGEDKASLLEVVGNSPAVAMFLAEIGKKFMESRLPDADAGATGKKTPGEAKLEMDEKIAEQLRDPEMRYKNPAKFARLNKEIKALAEMSLAGQG